MPPRIKLCCLAPPPPPGAHTLNVIKVFPKHSKFALESVLFALKRSGENTVEVMNALYLLINIYKEVFEEYPGET